MAGNISDQEGSAAVEPTSACREKGGSYWPNVGTCRWGRDSSGLQVPSTDPEGAEKSPPDRSEVFTLFWSPPWARFRLRLYGCLTPGRHETPARTQLLQGLSRSQRTFRCLHKTHEYSCCFPGRWDCGAGAAAVAVSGAVGGEVEAMLENSRQAAAEGCGRCLACSQDQYEVSPISMNNGSR